MYGMKVSQAEENKSHEIFTDDNSNSGRRMFN